MAKHRTLSRAQGASRSRFANRHSEHAAGAAVPTQPRAWQAARRRSLSGAAAASPGQRARARPACRAGERCSVWPGGRRGCRRG